MSDNPLFNSVSFFGEIHPPGVPSLPNGSGTLSTIYKLRKPPSPPPKKKRCGYWWQNSNQSILHSSLSPTALPHRLPCGVVWLQKQRQPHILRPRDSPLKLPQPASSVSLLEPYKTLTLDFGSKAWQSWGIDSSQFQALILPCDQFLGVQLPHMLAVHPTMEISHWTIKDPLPQKSSAWCSSNGPPGFEAVWCWAGAAPTIPPSPPVATLLMYMPSCNNNTTHNFTNPLVLNWHMYHQPFHYTLWESSSTYSENFDNGFQDAISATMSNILR